MQAPRAIVAGLALLARLAAAEPQHWTAADDASLAALRGGFATPSGLVVSFGITRTVQVDGAEVSRTSLRFDLLPHAGAAQAQALAAQRFAIVQSGAGNAVGPPSGPALAGVLVQNSANDKVLRIATVVDVTSNSLGLLQRLNFHQALSDALRLGR